MAVTEFLDAVDKKKKEEEAAMAPVSAEVAPAAPSVFGTPAPMESVVDTVGQVAVQSPFSQAAAAAPNPMAAAVDPMAQPDVLAAAPAVQAPAQVGLPPEERARIETRLAGTNADIVASGETVPSLGAATPEVAPAGTPLFQPTESGRKIYRGVTGAVNAAMDAGGNFVNSSSDVVADLISQSTGGRVNLQSSPEFGQASTSTAGPPIDDLRAFMSDLNEQASVQAPAQASATATPVVEMATPVPVADPSVNGTDVVTPEAITEAGQTAPEAVAPQTPTAGSGGMITRDSTGESFIGGSQVAATPEEVANYNATSREGMAAANTDAAAAERMRYNAPTINAQKERAAAVQAERDQPKAPVRATEQERRREEARSEKTFRKNAAKDIRAKVREFGRTNSMAKTREFERGLNEKLESDVIENRDYNRATAEANFANETAAYNRNTLTAAQRSAADLASEKQTASESKANLIRQANPNLPEAEIAAITSGSVRVVQNPSTGETTLLNLATGESKKVNTGQETGLNFDVATPENTLFSRAGEYTGAVEAAKRKGQGITGQFGVDVATDASIGAAQDFETAQNELVRAFRDSARYSATEANQLKKELNIALSPFEDPKTAEAKLRSIDKSLARRYKNEEAVALDENESIAKREDARSRARAISQFRATLGVPSEDAKPVEVKFDPKSLTGKNQQAYEWATSNPSDSRSQAILAKLNSQ